MVENIQVGWSLISSNELAEFYREISKKKKIDLEWSTPGSIDPQVFAKIAVINNNLEAINRPESQKNENSLSNSTSNNKFNICEDFLNQDDDNHIFEIKTENLNLNKRTTEKKVACMEKIFNDMLKTLANKQQSHNEDDVEKTIHKETSNVAVVPENKIEDCEVSLNAKHKSIKAIEQIDTELNQDQLSYQPNSEKIEEPKDNQHAVVTSNATICETEHINFAKDNTKQLNSESEILKDFEHI